MRRYFHGKLLTFSPIYVLSLDRGHHKSDETEREWYVGRRTRREDGTFSFQVSGSSEQILAADQHFTHSARSPEYAEYVSYFFLF